MVTLFQVTWFLLELDFLVVEGLGPCCALLGYASEDLDRNAERSSVPFHVLTQVEKDLQDLRRNARRGQAGPEAAHHVVPELDVDLLGRSWIDQNPHNVSFLIHFL
jgi:hypothetical protein